MTNLPKSLQTEEARQWREMAEAYEAMTTLAEQAGIDTSVCELCEEPLDDSEPWKRGLDGCGAHLSCLEPYLK